MSWFENPGVEVFRGLDISALDVDEAYLNITTDKSKPIHLYSLSEDCQRCPFSHVMEISNSRLITVDTTHNVVWRLYDRSDNIIDTNDNSSLICEVIPQDFGEFGVYDFLNYGDSCQLMTAKMPVNTILPLIFILGCLLLLSTIYTMFGASCKSYCMKIKTDKDDESGEQKIKRSRVKALDTFRGICLTFMVFVNDEAGHYWFLQHATWDGFLPADVIFPWFMWIMGVCIPISIKSQLKKGVPRSTMFLNALQRSCVLFLLGLMTNTTDGGPELHTLRLFGVLQRFGIVYLAVSSLSIFMTHRHPIQCQSKISMIFKDLIALSSQWIFVLAILIIHCYITFYMPVPGCPLGYLGAGGIQDGSLYSNCTGGVTRYIDTLLVGNSHMFQYPTVGAVYHTSAFDPEGVFGCLLSIVQVFLGVQAGAILINFHETQAQVKRWLTWGFIIGVLGLTLHIGGWIPINKNLWSLSFVLVTSSLAFILFSCCYLLVDHHKCWSGAPFIYPGMNSTIVYVGHMVCYKMFPWHWKIANMNTHFILTLEALWGTSLWVLIAYRLYEHQFFLSV